MQPTDRRQILDALERSREEFVAAITGTEDIQGRWKPALDRWSIAEVAEHVALAEAGMLQMITSGFGVLPEPAEAGREELFHAAQLDRTRTFTAPEGARPTGRFPTVQAALETFLRRRARTIEFVQRCNEDLRSRRIQHPVAGSISGMECLILLARHPARHAGQIREIKAMPGYPAPKLTRGV